VEGYLLELEPEVGQLLWKTKATALLQISNSQQKSFVKVQLTSGSLVIKDSLTVLAWLKGTDLLAKDLLGTS